MKFDHKPDLLPWDVLDKHWFTYVDYGMKIGYHRYLWQTIYGQHVPAVNLVFLNGNTLDPRPSNIARLVSIKAKDHVLPMPLFTEEQVIEIRQRIDIRKAFLWNWIVSTKLVGTPKFAVICNEYKEIKELSETFQNYFNPVKTS